MSQQARKSKRVALFSENDKLFLKGRKSFDRKQKHEFFKNLDQRFDELLKNLELMKRSKSLNSWKAFRVWRYHAWFGQDMIRQAFDNTQRIYVESIKHFPKGKGRKKQYFYWLDRGPLNYNRIDDRAFDSEFLFRHIRTGLTDTDKKLFLRAVDTQGILPVKKSDAISLDEIKKRLSGESIVRTNVRQVPTVTQDTFKDKRNYDINKIIEKHKKRNEKTLNKKLAKYDSKIMRYLVCPSFHGESE